MQTDQRQLDYAVPPALAGRSCRVMLIDVAVGSVQLAAGGVVAVVGYFLMPFLPDSVFDRPLDLIPNGIKRILHGRAKR